MVDYPYLFPTCGFRRVDDIRAELESQRDWDFSLSMQEANQHQKSAARRFGFVIPFDEEQIALAIYLCEAKAGPHIATYAWGLYAESLNVSEDSRRYA